MVNIMVQWLFPAILSLMHPFFVSVIEINHNAKSATVEISVRVFTQDLEKTLQNHTQARIDIMNPPDPAFLDKQIYTYLSQTLQLRVNGQPVKLNYIGHEIQKESVWTYLEVPKVADLKKLDITCTLLYDYEKTQSNIFHVKSKGEDKSYKLDYPETKTRFSF